MRRLKRQLQGLLQQARYEEIANLAQEKKRVLSALVSLTFDPDELTVRRAIQAMGLAADRIADRDPKAVQNHLQQLRWLINDESGGVCWHAPEAMAEIIRRRPDDFADYVPIIVTLLQVMAGEDLASFRPGVLWAIGRLGSIADAEVDAVLPHITSGLDDPSPRVRGLAVWCLEQTGRGQQIAGRDDLLADEATFEFFEDEQLKRVSVGQLARRALQLAS
jgi:hypothetical protein